MEILKFSGENPQGQ